MESHFVGAVIGVLGVLLAATLVKPHAERSGIPFPVLLVVAGASIGLAADQGPRGRNRRTRGLDA